MYHRLVPVSEPRGDFGGRLRLYGVMDLLRESCRWPGEGRWRGELVGGMRGLVRRYGGGGGWREWGDGFGCCGGG